MIHRVCANYHQLDWSQQHEVSIPATSESVEKYNVTFEVSHDYHMPLATTYIAAWTSNEITQTLAKCRRKHAVPIIIKDKNIRKTTRQEIS